MNYKCVVPKTSCVQKNADGMCKALIECERIDIRCEGCARVDNGFCKTFAVPQSKWCVGGVCPMATHIQSEVKAVKKLNPLKQSKKAIRNKKN